MGIESVPDPTILNSHDVILRVLRTAACGSDLHLIDGYIPTVRAGDILGHEFLGEVIETGDAVRNHHIGDRVVVCSFIACGQCWYCRHDLWSLCDNGNPNPVAAEGLWGFAAGGCFGYSHAMGGWAGSHAEYVRVPYADHGAFTVPDCISNERALFASDAAPTGWTGADQAGGRPGDTVAIWGAGAIGQMTARAAQIKGAARVVIIDRIPERLAQASDVIGAETLDYSRQSVAAELREMTAGRGPDVCIEAVGMEADRHGLSGTYDWITQQLRLQTGRPTAVREAIHACRKGGSVFILGVFGGLVDKFPLGAVINKNLTVRGSQQHGHRYIPEILALMQTDQLRTEHLATHTLPLADAAHGYHLFKHKQDGCVRPVFLP